MFQNIVRMCEQSRKEYEMGFFEKILSKVDDRMLAGERKSSAWSIYMSSPENADILKLATKDEAEISGVGASSSNVIEGILIDRYIPEDARARRCIVRMYLVDAEREGKKEAARPLPANGIIGALVLLCQDLAAGVKWQAAYPATKPLFAYMDKYFLDKNPMQGCGSEESAGRLAALFDSVLKLIESASEDELSACSGHFADSDGRALQTELALDGYPIFNITSFLNQFQPIVGNSTHTFRFLVALLESVLPVGNMASDRFKFGAFCDDFCTEWSRYDELRAGRYPETEIVTYELADGDSVELPEDYILLNPKEAKESSYVCVMEVRNGGKYGRVIHEPSGLRSGAPHFAYFLDKPVSELDTDDTARLRSAALNVWPDLKEVLDDEANSEDGAALVGFFPVAEESAAKWSSTRCVIHRNGEER